MKNTLLVLFAGLGIGFGMARLLSPSEPSGEKGLENPAPRGAERSARKAKSSATSISAAPSYAELKEMIRSSEGRVGRAQVLLAVSNLSMESLKTLAADIESNMSLQNYDSEIYALSEVVLETMVSQNADEAFDWILQRESISSRNSYFNTALRVLAQNNPDAAVARLSQLPESMSRGNALSNVIYGMVKTDPKKAMSFYQKQDDLSDDQRFNILRTLAGIYPESAAKELEKTSAAYGNNRWAARSIFSQWAMKDKEAVLAYAAEAKSPGLKQEAMAAVFKIMSLEDPEGAYTLAMGKSGEMRTAALKAVISQWIDRDPKMALSRLGAIENVSLKNKVRMEIFNDLSWRQPKLAAEMVLAMESGDQRRQLADRLSWSLDRLSLSEQNTILESFEGPEKNLLLVKMAEQNLSRDVDKAIKLFGQLDEKSRGGWQSRNFFKKLSLVDGEKAIKFANNLPGMTEKNRAVSVVLQSIAENSPEKAIELAKKMPAGMTQLRGYGAIAAEWGKSDSEAALKWAEGLSGNDRIAALIGVLPAQATQDAAAAGSRLAELISNAPAISQPFLGDASQSVARAWLKKDPEAAANWAASLDSDKISLRSVDMVVREWSSSDSMAASEWVNNLESGQLRDAAISPLVKQIRETDPESAVVWAGNISDEGKRRSTLRSTYRRWYRNDPEAARAAFDASDLSGSDHQEVQKAFE